MKRAFTFLGLALLIGVAGSAAGERRHHFSLMNQTKTRAMAIGNDPSVPKLALADAAFGFNMLRQLTHEAPRQNVFISPFSISNAMQMVLNGAKGRTQSQIRKALSLDEMPLADVNEANRLILAAVSAPGKTTTLSVANALWFDNQAEIVPAFQETCSHSYQAQTTKLDFQSADAAPAVNRWVSGITHGKISQLVSSGDLQGMAAVLTNAIYFKGNWTTPFKSENTKDALFTGEDGKTHTVPLMYVRHSFGYTDTGSFQAVSLRYQDDHTSMVILLPHEGTSLGSVISGLNTASWQSVEHALAEQDVELFLPRFKLQYKANLNDPLLQMGMPLAFGRQADFSGMSRQVGAISKVIHKSVLEVDEKGTVAAAATGVVMTMAMAMPRHQEPVVVRVDHPFIVIIEDNQTGVVLFTGAVYDPQR
jgi:serpin B